MCLALAAAGVASSASIGFAAPTDAGDTETTDDNSDELTLEPEETEEPDEPADPVSIAITEYPKNMNVGDTSTISYELENAAKDASVRWDSSDGNIVAVDSDGTVRALSPGKAEITASLGDARASILISVAEQVILPASFSVDVEGLTPINSLLGKYDLKIGDELRMSVKVEPADSKWNGVFEWATDVDGIVSISTQGDRGEAATLIAEGEGEVALTVRYVDGSANEEEKVSLQDNQLSFSVTEAEPPIDFMLIVILIIIAAIVIIALIAISRSRRRRRRAERAYRERAARRPRGDAARTRASRDERERLRAEGYERGYRDSEADQFKRATRVYDAPPSDYDDYGDYEDGDYGDGDYDYDSAPGEYDAEPEQWLESVDDAGGAGQSEAPRGDGEPDKPFSVDDIE
jgi:type II secretory pathway pseudopilin PulG